VRERFGRIGEKVARGLLLRHDHGTQYMADDFQEEIAFLGIESSPSFVRAPDVGNGCAERMIRTLKEQVLWVRTVRHGRAIAPGAAGLTEGLQRALDGGPPRPPQPGAGASRSPRCAAEAGGVNYALRRVQGIGSGTPARSTVVARACDVETAGAGAGVAAPSTRPSGPGG